MNILASANIEEVEKYYTIIDDAKKFQQEQGFHQWSDDYPNIGNIKEDIRQQSGYALKVNGQLAGYMCISFDGEPDYLDIDGSWHSDKPYAVIHRMALSREFRRKGFADTAFHLIEKLCLERNISYLRIDTDSCNKRMQHILEKNGFIYCGVVMIENSEKLAFDKLL